jgi:hypothetical protein
MTACSCRSTAALDTSGGFMSDEPVFDLQPLAGFVGAVPTCSLGGTVYGVVVLAFSVIH